MLVICYNTVGSSFFYLFRDNIVSISTRNPQEKAKLKFIRQVSWTLISGMVIGMLLSMVVLPFWLEKNIKGYPILMITISVLAIPFLLMEYFYTKERVIEDVAQTVGLEKENNIPVFEQLKALLTDKYFVILTILTIVGGIADNFRGGNVQYFYIKFLLGGAENPMMFTLFQVVTGIPLGIGLFALWPLAKKFGIKNICIAGYSLVFVSSIIGWIFPSNLPIVFVAGFVKQIGMLPHAYIFATLICYAYDHIEYKSHLRLEGLMGAAIIVAIQSCIFAPFAGGFEASILKLGFVDAQGVMASESVKSFMVLSFYLFDIITSGLSVILLFFVDVEKKLPTINSELIRRQKEAVLARGEEWIEPDELDRLEKEKAEQEAEENRIADLKEHCRKKGLDFEAENAKYLAKEKAKLEKKKQKVSHK